MYMLSGKPDLILLDIDDVIADLRGKVLEIFDTDENKIPDDVWHQDNLYEIVGLSESEFWDKVDDGGSEFWSGLEFLPWGEELYETCKSLAPTVLLTSPTMNPQCSAGKQEWIADKLQTRDFLIGPAKWACAGGKSLLIDDRKENCDPFEDKGGDIILFPRDWNDGIGTPEDVIEELKKLTTGGKLDEALGAL